MNIYNDISVIIPTREIDSILINSINEIRKLYQNTEIIIVADIEAKNDNILNDENLTIIKSPHKTISAKRNEGVSNSNKKYIAFLDSDAFPRENWLETGITFLENNKEYSAVTGCQYNSPQDTIEQQILRHIRFNRLFTHSQWTKIIDYSAEPQDCTELMTSNVIMRRDDFIKLEGFNTEIYLAEDNEFSARMIKRGYKIRFLPEFAVFHRETKLYAWLRKIYCMGYYYCNSIIKGKTFKDRKDTITSLMPLILAVIYIAIFLLFLYLKLNVLILLILPFIAIIIIMNEARLIAEKIKVRKAYSFVYATIAASLFIAVYLISSFLGIINFPTKDIKKLYKH